MDTGFTRSAVTFHVSLDEGYGKPEQRVAFYKELMAKLEALPGVEAAGSVNQLLREGREWPDTTARQGGIDPARAGLLDEDSAPAVDGGDGSDLQWLDPVWATSCTSRNLSWRDGRFELIEGGKIRVRDRDGKLVQMNHS